MANRKSIYNKIKKRIPKLGDAEEDNIDPSVLEAGMEKEPEEEELPEDFKEIFADATREELLREIYNLSMEYKKVKRDREIMNFKLTKMEMERDRS